MHKHDHDAHCTVYNVHINGLIFLCVSCSWQTGIWTAHVMCIDTFYISQNQLSISDCIPCTENQNQFQLKGMGRANDKRAPLGMCVYYYTFFQCENLSFLLHHDLRNRMNRYSLQFTLVRMYLIFNISKTHRNNNQKC